MLKAVTVKHSLGVTANEVVHVLEGTADLEDEVAQPGREETPADEVEVRVPRHQDYRLVLSDGIDDPGDDPVLIEDGAVPRAGNALEHSSVDVVRTNARRLDIMAALLHLETQTLIDREGPKL